MAQAFVPRTNNSPAKVKDKGIINLVLQGAGVYNAKNGELLLLPEGLAEKDRLIRILFERLLSDGGFQPVDCCGSADSVFSLAERYAREYGEQALFWSQERCMEVALYGWGESADEIADKISVAVAVVTETVGEKSPISFLTGTKAGARKVLIGTSATDKNSWNVIAGFKCVSCGEQYLPDSEYGEPAESVNATAAPEELRDVYTPDAHTIPLLCDYLNIPVETTLKAMLYTVEPAGGGKLLLFAMIRGDRDISIPKLAAWVENNYAGALFRRAEEREITVAFGEVAGFCGPVGVPDNVLTIADLSLKGGRNFVVGGNRPDYHKTGCCWGRDFQPPLVDLVLYTDSLPCPKCGQELREAWFRQVCELEYYHSEARGEKVLSCRDRDGTRSWPHRLSGRISLTPVLLSKYENGGGEGE